MYKQKSLGGVVANVGGWEDSVSTISSQTLKFMQLTMLKIWGKILRMLPAHITLLLCYMVKPTVGHVAVLKILNA